MTVRAENPSPSSFLTIQQPSVSCSNEFTLKPTPCPDSHGTGWMGMEEQGGARGLTSLIPHFLASEFTFLPTK